MCAVAGSFLRVRVLIGNLRMSVRSFLVAKRPLQTHFQPGVYQRNVNTVHSISTIYQFTSSHHCMLTVQSLQLHPLSLSLSQARQVLHRFLLNSPEVQDTCSAGHLSGLAEQQWQGQSSELPSSRSRKEAGTCVDYGYCITTASHVSDLNMKI